MNQDTKPAPFNLGDHVRYVAPRALAAGHGNDEELVLTHGMEGVIMLSTGTFNDANARKPWHCRVQFQNGFQLDITPENRCDFELTRCV
jgi:hypothetical protein